MITASIALDHRNEKIGPNLQPYLDLIRSIVPVEHGDVRRDISVQSMLESICNGSFN